MEIIAKYVRVSHVLPWGSIICLYHKCIFISIYIYIYIRSEVREIYYIFFKD